MAIIDITPILVDIKKRFGLVFRSENRHLKEGYGIQLIPEGLSSSEGFNLNLVIGWKRITIDFIPGDRAGDLLVFMGQSSLDNKAVFSSVGAQIKEIGGIVSLEINGEKADCDSPISWPEFWQGFSLTVKSPFIETDGDLSKDNNLPFHLQEWIGLFISLIFPLLPLEEIPIENLDSEGLPEGARIAIQVNRYERNKANRQACISAYGTKCQICGFNFGKAYGEIGEGYIEVHHITPVSQLGAGYLINPIKDLIPVCSNCHSILHRKSPPYLLEEIRRMLIEN